MLIVCASAAYVISAVVWLQGRTYSIPFWLWSSTWACPEYCLHRNAGQYRLLWWALPAWRKCLLPSDCTDNAFSKTRPRNARWWVAEWTCRVPLLGRTSPIELPSDDIPLYKPLKLNSLSPIQPWFLLLQSCAFMNIRLPWGQMATSGLIVTPPIRLKCVNGL